MNRRPPVGNFPYTLNPDDVRAISEAGRTLREALRLLERGKYTEAAEQARMAQKWLADCAEYDAASKEIARAANP